MNGAEHYREAERLAAEAAGQQAARTATIALAQVHATLALAAAQAAPLVDKYMGDSAHVTDWGRAIGHLTPAGHPGAHATDDGYRVWPTCCQAGGPSGCWQPTGHDGEHSTEEVPF